LKVLPWFYFYYFYFKTTRLIVNKINEWIHFITFIEFKTWKVKIIIELIDKNEWNIKQEQARMRGRRRRKKSNRRQDVLYWNYWFFYCIFIVAFMRVLFRFYGYICFHCYLMRHKHKLTKYILKKKIWEPNKYQQMSKQMNCGLKAMSRLSLAPSLTHTLAYYILREFLWSIKMDGLRWWKA
jgi:hypothetical protein